MSPVLQRYIVVNLVFTIAELYPSTTIVTARVCPGEYVSVCLHVQGITFECLDIETSFLVWWDILTISRSSLSIKVIG